MGTSASSSAHNFQLSDALFCATCGCCYDSHLNFPTGISVCPVCLLEEKKSKIVYTVHGTNGAGQEGGSSVHIITHDEKVNALRKKISSIHADCFNCPKRHIGLEDVFMAYPFSEMTSDDVLAVTKLWYLGLELEDQSNSTINFLYKALCSPAAK